MKKTESDPIRNAAYLAALEQGIATERRTAEDARRESDGRYRALFDYAPDGIVISDLNGYYIDANASICRMLGYSCAELIGLHASNIVDPSEIPHIEPALKSIKAASDYRREWQFKRKDGSVFAADVIATMMPDGNILAMIRDITERKISERRLRQKKSLLHASDRRLAEILQGMTDACFLLDTEWRFMFVNDRCESLLHHPRADMLGRSIWEVFPQLVGTPIEANYRIVMAERLPVAFEVLSPIAERWLDVRLFPTGEGIAAFLLDISTRKQLEEQFRRAQKMEAFGQLAGGIAHDFNNLLTIINGYSALLLEHTPEDNPDREVLQEIQKAGERSAALTRQLLTFSRRQIISPKLIDLNSVVAEMGRLLRRIIGEDVQLTTILPRDLGTVRADPSLIEQMIMNLAVNARDAMSAGGQLTIETSNVDFDTNHADPQMEIQAGSYVLISVRDTGTGMTEEVRKHIFEPFFTTKEPGKGTGLGLAVVHGVVQQSGGYIQALSKRGVGSTFQIYLPREASAGVESVAAKIESVRGFETVLLVEDDGGVRTLTRLMLADLGYTVLEADSGREGLHVAEEHKGPIHIVITDVVMPLMSGRQMVEILLLQNPQLKILYMSGYTDDAIVRHGILQHQAQFLQKPFTAIDISQKVRSALDAA